MMAGDHFPPKNVLLPRKGGAEIANFSRKGHILHNLWVTF
jgi:hypothetical protein